MKKGIYLLLLAIISSIIYFRWIQDAKKTIDITKQIKSKELKINITEYALKTGLYLKVSGKFTGRDSLHEYVFYSQPFGLGPQKEITPMKKISIGKNAISRTEDFFYCLSKDDSLFYSPKSFDMETEDVTILSIADSLLSSKKSVLQRYKKNYQNLLLYKKLHFANSDEGLFFPLE